MSVLADKNIMVTGGAGAFGQAFVRRALAEDARRVVVFSRSESRQAELRAALPDPRLRWFLGDVRDQQRLTQALRGVDIAVHAAAQKRVEYCESDPHECLRTNVIGSEAVALAAIECGVSRALLLSTDKAASPNTTYGASKLMAERVWNASNVYAAGTRTRFAVSRYGNVIGSTGSVVPIWRAQAKAGQPLSLTDRRMSRFLMTMGEAVETVLFALEHMSGGEVFVPRLRGARMTDLAEAVAPGLPIAEIGIRPGEKLHETLITEDEFRLTDSLGKYYIVRPGSTQMVEGRSAYRSDDGPMMEVEELRKLVA